MEGFRSIKHQTEISYHKEDIDFSEAGEWCCNGFGDNDKEYMIIFDETVDGRFQVRDVIEVDW